MILPVIIIHWNEPERCAATVANFLSQSPAVRVLIVDNGSRLGALAEVESLVGPRVELLPLPFNTGYGPAANRGIEHALGLLDAQIFTVAPHDALPALNCLTRMQALFEQDSKIGLLGADFAKSSRQHFGWIRGMRLVPAPPYCEGFHESFYPTGTLMMLGRKCILDIGLFDTRYFAYSEEHDLGLRARRAGWKVGIAGGAIVYNPGRTAGSEITVHLNLRNSLLLVRDHFGLLASLVRSFTILANGIVNTFLWKPRQSGDGMKVRLRALVDFWLGRFGPPR